MYVVGKLQGYPTNSFPVKELRNPSIDVSALHKARQLTGFVTPEL